MALPADGQNANGLTKVTQIPAGKELMFIDPTTNEGGIITLEDLTKQILNGLTSQTFGLDSGTQTLPAAINYLYGKSLKCKRFPSPSSETDILEYAYNIVQTNEVGVEIIGTANVTDSKAYGYSPGLILHNYDTCAILLVNFTNGNIQTNICTRAGGWKGWKEFAGV